MNRVTVKINNSDYVLKGEESEEYLNQIGFTVNKMIDTLIKSNKKLNIYDAAVLTACNLVDENNKSEREIIDSRNNELMLKAVTQEQAEEIERLKESNMEITLKMSELKTLDKSMFDKKDEEIKRLLEEVKLLKESVNEYREDNENLSKSNNSLKFELQNYKYKVLDLQNKLFEAR